MKFHPCDQIAADTFQAERRAVDKHGVSLSLHVGTTESLVGFVASRYQHGEGGEDFEALLEFALDRHEPFASDPQRDGYKIALGIIFQRRKAASVRVQKDLERARPFAPLSAYEQET